MTDRPVTTLPGPAQVAPTPVGLEPDAIGVAQDTIFGMATSAPAGTVAGSRRPWPRSAPTVAASSC